MRRLLCALAMMVLAWSGVGPDGAGGLARCPGRPPPPPPENQAEPLAEMERGLDKERGRNWAGAMEVYREALERWPSRVEFSRRLRLCEIHFKLNRRYSDASFRNVLLALPHDQATELYDEVLERIQSNYVDAVPWEPLVRHGLDNLEVALRDPVFLKANAPLAAPERVTWVRETLRQYRANLAIPDRAAAIRMAVACGELGQQAIGLAATPVLLEFTCGACDALDDFTSYLTPDKLEDLYAMIDGNFVGLGIELKLDKEGLRLVGVIRGGPAWEAGLQPGDTIIKVDGVTHQGAGPRRVRQQAPGRRGEHRSSSWSARRTAACGLTGWSAATSRSRASAGRRSWTRRQGSAISGSPASRRRRPTRSTRRSAAWSRRGCGSWCSTSGVTRAAC